LKENPSLEPFHALKKKKLCKTRSRLQAVPCAVSVPRPSPHKEFKWAKTGKIYEKSMSNPTTNVVDNNSSGPGKLSIILSYRGGGVHV
jgi:hypothetical protein